MKTTSEHSAGGCVYKQSQQQTLWLLGKHSGYHKWVLPKGLIESGETPDQTAIREIKEELSVTAIVIGNQPIHTISYSYQATPRNNSNSTRRIKTYQEDQKFAKEAQKVQINKIVDFFLMEYVSGDPKDHGWEMETGDWFTIKDSIEKLAFPDEQHALKLAHAKIQNLS